MNSLGLLITFRASSWLSCAMMLAFLYARIRTIPGRYNSVLLWSAFLGLVGGFWYVVNPVRPWWIQPPKDGSDVTGLPVILIALAALWTIVSGSRAVQWHRQHGSRSDRETPPTDFDDEFATLGTELAAHRLDAGLPLELRTELELIMNDPKNRSVADRRLVIRDRSDVDHCARR